MMNVAAQVDTQRDEYGAGKWVPKVGERVRYKRRSFGEATVVEVKGEKVVVDTHGRFGICTEFLSSLEPLPVAAEAQPAGIKIEAGRYYKTRDGRKVGPMELDPVDETYKFGGVDEDDNMMWFTPSGSYWREDKPSNDDLIAEWVDEPIAQPTTQAAASNDNAAPAKFKVGDRVKSKTVEEAGIGVVISLDPFQVDYKDTWFRICSDKPESVELVAPATQRRHAIVCLIEDGQPKPAYRPHVHPDVSEATGEAERLALKYPGQEFGVYVLAGSKVADVVTETVTRTVLRAA